MDPNILTARRKFTITCTPDDGVVIEDGNGKKGGNVRSKGGKALSWKNATDQPVCYLRFTLMPDAETDDPGEPEWPFAGEPPPGLLLEVPQGGWTTRTLKVVTDTECVEYEVLDAKQQPLLDPIIIIDPN